MFMTSFRATVAATLLFGFPVPLISSAMPITPSSEPYEVKCFSTILPGVCDRDVMLRSKK